MTESVSKRPLYELAIAILADTDALHVKLDEISAEARTIVKIARECREIAHQCRLPVVPSPGISGALL